MKKTTAKKVPAKRSGQRRQTGVLLERTDKVVTKDKGTVLKIFGPSYKVSAILNEAMNEARRYLKQFVAIQCQIFAKTSERMGNLADKLDKQISASPLPKETRYDLHMKLQSFPRGKALCHGDFNPTNVIITPKGDWRVIDWSHVRLGDPLADVARTYLLFWLSGHVAAAEKYMALACEALKVKLPDVQKWLPIVAAAESSRDQTPKNHELLVHWASVVDIE